MKKRYAFLLLMVITISSIVAQTANEKWDILKNYRIDYFNENGVHFSSTYPESSMDLVNVYPASYGNDNDGFSVTNGVNYCSKVQLIPYGVYSYPVQIVAEEDVKVTVVSEEAKSSRIKKALADEEHEFKCGDKLTFVVDIPNGCLPTLDIEYLYSGISSSYSPYWANKVDYLFQPAYLGDKNYQESVKVLLDKDGGVFEKDPAVDGRWILTLTMENEPTKFSFRYLKRDAALFNQLVADASQKLYRIISGYTYQVGTFFCGDPWTTVTFGEAMSSDDISTRNIPSFETFTSLNILEANRIPSYATWYYYLGMIEMSNMYLEKLPHYFSNTPGVTSKDLKKAEAVLRTLRAHSYFRLLQVFGPRWEDSKKGAIPVAPIYTDWRENTDKKLATFKEISELIRDDLGFAKQNLPEKEGENKIIPHKAVAYGISARHALLCEDWGTAAADSQYLLSLYPLTTNEELVNGFCESTPSWIWTASNPANMLGFYSYQSSAAINGAYPLFWSRGCVVGCMDRKLYLQIPEGDVRRTMYIMPENGLNDFNFYNFDLVDGYGDGRLYASRLKNEAMSIVEKYTPFFVEQGLDQDINLNTGNLYFGSQMKFWGHSTGWNSVEDEVCFMRTEEFLLTRAEALFHLGDEVGARDWINSLNTLRNPGHKQSAATDNALLEEIRLARRIELWGEGFSFFDFKRWNIPLERQVWAMNEKKSGNWPETIGRYSFVKERPSAENGWTVKLDPSVANGWRAMIPVSMVTNNTNIDVSSLGYSNVSVYEIEKRVPSRQTPNNVPVNPSPFILKKPNISD